MAVHTVYREAERFSKDWLGQYVAYADDLLLGLDGQPWPERLLVTRQGRIVAGGVLARGATSKTQHVVYRDPGAHAAIVESGAR